ncbi:hypothetical protein [Singulisphaera sp. PoT]|uniref:hypothetical protein n=1 Tax=Singulisphaera sp. PoT TaxID=3411797 RepID=UPI003BF5222B
MAILVVLGWDEESRAASVSSHTSNSVIEDHGRDCKCGRRCRGASCCCGKAEARPQTRTSPAKAPVSYDDPNPCLNSAPCDDPVAPSPRTVSPLTKAAALVASLGIAPDSTGEPLHVAPQHLVSPRSVDRLDDPPELA